MSALGQAVGGLIGGISGMASEGGDKNRSEAARAKAHERQIYETQVAGIQGNAYDKVDPTSRNAMLQALADYQNKVAHGGLDAKAQANLEMTQGRAQQTGAQTAAQIQGAAARRGAAQGPASMVAQQVAQQQASQGAQMGAVQSAAMAEDAKNAALQGQMGAAGNIYGMDAQKAQAANQIAAFNVQNSQQNVKNMAHQRDQLSGLDTGDSAMYERRALGDNYAGDAASQAGQGKAIGGSAGGIVGGMMGGWPGGGAGGGQEELGG